MTHTGSKASTALEQLLEEINFQRTKEMRQFLRDGNELSYESDGI